MTSLYCGSVEVRPSTRELLIDGEAVAVERRAFDLLVYLMQHADRVVDKDELLGEVWAGRPVSESTLAQAVSRARRALNTEDPEDYIANVYGVGYRFARPVSGGDASAGPSAAGPEQVPTSRWPAVIWPALALVVVAFTLSIWQPWRSESKDPLVRVAVLPVQNDTGDATLEWVSYGVLPLIERALADAGSDRVSTSTVLSTLRRYPEAEDLAGQAEVLRLSTGADQVLVPRLTVVERGYRLDLQSVGESDETYSFSLQGDDIAVLAVAAGTTLSERLSRWQGAQRARSSVVTDDQFVNEAFVRGLDARLRGRYQDAARYFDTVVAAAPDLLDAKYHLSLVTRRLGDWDYTQQLNEELLAAAEAAGNASMLAAVQTVSGTLAWRRGDKAAAQQWYEQALANYQAENNADYIANVTANLGILAATRGDYASAEQRFEAALAHYVDSNDRFNEATARRNLGNLYSDQGRYDEAESALLEALRLRQELDLPLQVAMTLNVLGDIEMARGQWPEAMAYQQRVLAAAEEYENPLLEAQSRADLSATLRRLGRLEEARLSAAQAVAIAMELDNPSSQAFALLQQGLAEADLGNGTRAGELFEEAVDIYQRLDEPLGQAKSLLARADVLIGIDRLDDAEAVIVAAEDLVRDSEITRLDPALSRIRSTLAAARGDARGALDEMSRAYSLAQASQTPIDKLDMGGQLGLLLQEYAPDDSRLVELVREMESRAGSSGNALAFLAAYFSGRDPEKALGFMERQRRLAGEGWTPEDEQKLVALQRMTAGG
ncbi:MAG: tetratricopeptide repeat protein [Xanthomonadales bacterium]|nr:tetratricopeptide repeat protein [Xanthomonadales bacterium]